MRSISNSILNKFDSRVQAGANKLTASLWVGRPTTPLTDDRFLEKQEILSSSDITAVDVSVCHPNIMRGATYVYIAYIESGIAKVKRAKYKENMPDHLWENVDFAEEAVDVSICFDGTMPKASNGTVEFKTEQIPWVFWVDNVGALYGKKLGEENAIKLAETNCTVVSSVRAMWSTVGGFDFGLIIFFLLNGTIYYRQLVDGEWFDAEIVSFGPKTTYSDIAVFRTWDYRVGIQAKSSDGKYYELFTQFMGIGKQNTEHLEIKDVKSKGDLSYIEKINMIYDEHIDVSDVVQERPYGGLYSLDIPKFVEAYNIEDENGDWGTTIIAKMNVHLPKEQIENLYAQFAIIDSMNVRYTPSSAILHDDGKTITFMFMNFNNARGACKMQYTPGTIESMANVKLVQTYVTFIPQNLVPVNIPVPEVESLWNE